MQAVSPLEDESVEHQSDFDFQITLNSVDSEILLQPSLIIIFSIDLMLFNNFSISTDTNNPVPCITRERVCFQVQYLSIYHSR